MADFDEPFEASYRYMRVARESGDEVSVLRGFRNGGSIERNPGKDTYESASVPYAGLFDIGADLVRAYLDARFYDGSSVSECLGTFLPSMPSRPIDGPMSNGSGEMHGRLKELADDDFDVPMLLPAGTPAVRAAMAICAEVGLEVVADDSDYELPSAMAFGVGTDYSDKLSAVNKLLDMAGFFAARTDAYGRVVMRRYSEPSARPVAHKFIEGPTARFLGKMEESLDRLDVANVVHVDFSTQGSDVRGTAVDDDPASEFGVPAVGRRIVKTYQFSDLPGSAVPKDNNLLKGASTMTLGSGKASDSTFRKSMSGGAIENAFFADSPVSGVYLGIRVRSNGSEVGFCQDEVGRVSKGKTYTQSVWVRGAPGLKVMIQPWWAPSEGDGSATATMTMTGGWMLATCSGECGDARDVSMGYVYLESAGTLDVVCDKVEEGASATEWPQGAMQAAADAKASQIMRTERCAVRTVKLEHVYRKLSPHDAIEVDFPTGSIRNMRLAIWSQTLTLAAGCPVTCEARSFER